MITRNSIQLFICLLLSVLMVAGNVSCNANSTSRSVTPNIVLIVPDALRAKQLPCYGYQKIKTPAIDTLVKDSVLFEHALVRTPVTQPSFSCLFSGLLLPLNCLRGGEKTMAQFLNQQGYDAIGIIGSRVMSTWSPMRKTKKNFDRGFDQYIQDAVISNKSITRENEAVTADVLNWLSERKGSRKPFFIFVHYIDPHSPCDPDYNGEVKKIDREVGKIIEKLKEQHLYENSLIIFTSDHGESLGDPIEDHGSIYGHGWFTYLEQIRVPLIMKFPRSMYKQTVNQVVRNYDLLPTILDLIGCRYKKGQFDGVSLLPIMKHGKELNLVSYHIARVNRICPGNTISVVYSFENSLFHFIRGMYAEQRQELYDIGDDPGEQSNLFFNPVHQKALTRGKDLLNVFKNQYIQHQNIVKSLARNEANPLRTSIEESKGLRALKSLGYIKGGAPSQDITSGQFLMTMKLGTLGMLNYRGIIRQSLWGIEQNDDFFPEKVATLDNLNYYIVANQNRGLFVYNRRTGFQFLKIQNVDDLAIDRNENIVYGLKDGRIIHVGLKNRLNKFSNKLFESKSVRSHSLYIDRNSKFYLFSEDEIVKIDKTGMVLGKYKLGASNSNIFAVDSHDNIFLGLNNDIFKYDKNGIFIKKISLKKKFKSISAIEIDQDNRIWVLRRNSPEFLILDQYGKRINGFKYNRYHINPKRKEWVPVPTKNFLLGGGNLVIVDDWEGILVYDIK